jgi:hypothetical protein
VKSKRTPKSAVWLLAVASAAVSTCQASVIFGNLPGSGAYTGSEQGLNSTDEIAIGVMTGSTAEQFSFLQGYFVGAGTLGGGIFNNSGGSPGAEIGVFGGQTISASKPTLVTFTTSSNVVLQANTEYWFVVDPPVLLAWAADSSNGGNGTLPAAENGSGYTSEGYIQSTTSGSTWTSDNTLSPTVQINGSMALPEPGSLTMFACGCAMFFARRLARRR